MTQSTTIAIARPVKSQKVFRKTFGFWAYNISDPEDRDDVYYSFPTREEALAFQAKIGDGTTVKESWESEHV
jgi:hypothetical protein